MKLLLILTVLFFSSCSKEQPQPQCYTLISTGTLYNDNWELLDTWVIYKVERLCDKEEINRFRDIIANQPANGYWICPPEKRFETWKLIPTY